MPSRLRTILANFWISVESRKISFSRFLTQSPDSTALQENNKEDGVKLNFEEVNMMLPHVLLTKK